MATSIDMQLTDQTSTDKAFDKSPADIVKCSASSSQTSRTVVESSEEFTLSGEMTTASADPVAENSLHLSNMVIVEEQTTTTRPTKVKFAEDVYFIKEEDVAVKLPQKKKSKKKLMEEETPEHVLPSDMYWSAEELRSLENNAMYMVKESQQYQEEVIITVLYNKAFLSADNLSKSITEEELEEKLKDVHQYSHTLEKWTALGNSRRGLENFVSDKAILDAAQSRMMVLHFQQELKEEVAESSLAPQHAEFLAKRCQDTSRTARIMARMMGQADADSLAHAEELATPNSLPEPPGRFAGDHEPTNPSERIGRAARNRRGSVMHSVKKAVGHVFKRQGSVEVNQRRIRKIQQRRAAELGKLEPEKRPSQEFRRSFLDTLEYGEQ